MQQNHPFVLLWFWFEKVGIGSHNPPPSITKSRYDTPSKGFFPWETFGLPWEMLSFLGRCRHLPRDCTSPKGKTKLNQEFQPLDGNPPSGWKSHQGLVGFPSICPKMTGWKSNHPSVKGRHGFMISFQIFLFEVFKSLKVKVDYHSLEFGDLLQLKWGTLWSSIVPQ